MSMKLRISNFLKQLRGEIHALFRAKTAQQPVNDFSPSMPKSKGGRPPVVLDEARAMRLRQQGWSDHKIARKFGVAPSTIGSRLRNYVPPILPTPPASAQCAPTAAYKAPVLTAIPKPPIIVERAQRAPVATQQVLALPPAPYGIDAIPAGTKAFFLVRGESNMKQAGSYNQLAIGIEQWHPQYATLPAFRDVERIWVVVSANEDNRAFILSLSSDIWIRERCVINTKGVHHVCQNRLQMIRTRRFECETEEQLCQGFEEIHKFQPVPLPGHTDKINELCRRPESDAYPFAIQ